MLEKCKFTLIELLVVIAIIGILVSILFPSLSIARGTAISSVCVSQVKQLGYAHTMYSDENSQKTLSLPEISKTAWFEFIYPYHESPQLIQCPAVDHSGTGWRWGTNVTGWGGDSGWMRHNGHDAAGSYGINGYTYNDLTWHTDWNYKTIMEPEVPSITLLFMDMSWIDAWQNASNANPTEIDGSGGSFRRTYLYRHVKNKTSVSFMDGSAKSIPVRNILMLDWHKESQHRLLPAL
ncbi:MAG: type II secretion system GspH family protein [Lentisphaerales bacterium]|nr:type II secretion system GspH family protein [Lentisphaerales bacterium]